jgi:hypothetical protein
MADAVVENLILDLLEWLARQDRGYEEDGRLAHVVSQTARVGRSQ